MFCWQNGKCDYYHITFILQSPAGLMIKFYCLNILDSPSLEGQVHVFISPRIRLAQLYHQALGKDRTLRRRNLEEASAVQPPVGPNIRYHLKQFLCCCVIVSARLLLREGSLAVRAIRTQRQCLSSNFIMSHFFLQSLKLNNYGSYAQFVILLLQFVGV